MSQVIVASNPGLMAGLALAAAAFLAALERPVRQGPLLIPPLPVLTPLVVLAPFALAVAAAPHAELGWPALAVALAVAILARAREDVLQSECAVKLMWVMGGSLAFTTAGHELLVIATGTPIESEQWAVLALGLDPRPLWSTAVPLTLLTGLVLLGGAPFHFWPADLFQGARPWLAPLAVAALQSLGGASLVRRLEGIEQFPPAAQITDVLLGSAALIAFLAGAATLLMQRRPERRVGTLASLNGALVLAALATARSGRTSSGLSAEDIGVWAGHLALALSGASTLTRFVPVSPNASASAPVLFRRHPLSGTIGLFALFSLAGVPGTPGARLWLAVARDLAASSQSGLLIALGVAWLGAFSTAVKQLRECFGIRTDDEPPTAEVPWQARGAMWVSGGALLAWVVAELVR
jgi:NADH:ubiquinone oxidoreductase subunit 2 (subunit N)